MGLFSNIFGTYQPSAVASAPSSKKSETFSDKGRILFSAGEVVKGEVEDLRSSEVTLRLEDGRTLHARLSSATELTIGQQAEFLVSEADEALITLKILTDGDPSFAESAIDKALAAAGLPSSDNNIAVVRSLLDAGLPAGKDMIQKMLQYSAANKGVELSTLTALIKNNLPVTKENASELQAYRNYEHRLISQSQTMLSALTNALSQGEATQKEMTAILSLFSKETADALPTGKALSGDSFLPGETTARFDDVSFSQKTDASAFLQAGASGGMDFTDPSLLPLFERAKEQNSRLGNLLSQTMDTVNASFLPPKNETEATLFPLKDLNLTENEQQHLVDLSQSLSAEFENAGIPFDKTATQDASSLFAALGKLHQKSPDFVRELFQKEPLLSDLLGNTLLSDFVMTPKELEKEGAVHDFYEKLNQKLSRMASLSDEAGSSLVKLAGQTASKMQENLRFMNTLNQVFPYVQLPLKLTEQLTHGELYVYSKKKELSDPGREVRILLHLDMENLGQTDVHLSLFAQNVNATFYLSDEKSLTVVQNEMPSLIESLSQKGYSLNASVLRREKDPDIVKDFMAGSEGISMKRFRFDIRA